MRGAWCVLVLAGLSWGCERGAAKVEAPSLVVKGVLLEAEEQAPGIAGLPEAGVLKAEVEAALKARSSWVWREGAAEGTHMRVAYVYQQAETPDGAVLLLLLDGSLGMSKTERGEALPLKCERVVGDAPGAKERSSAAALMTRGIAECLDDLEGSIEVDRTADQGLAAILGRPGLPRAGALRALNRVREGKVTGALPGVRALLKADDVQVVLSAASAAAALKDQEAGAAMVEAAELLSRGRRWPELVAMLTLLGDLGGEAAARYLEAVSEGHEDVEIKRVAAGALERAKAVR